MKKLIITLFAFLFFINSFAAETPYDYSEDINVSEHWISLTKSYDIETKTQKLGTLYRRLLSLFLTYDFYDTLDHHTLTAKIRFFSFGADLDLYDPEGTRLGSIEEKIFSFFPTFEIYAPNLSTKLARAEMNFWGTKFYIYDPASDREMAVMSRPFFRFKNDWTIHVTDQELLAQKNIDSRVFITVLAIQGEIEDWQRKIRENDNTSLKATKLPNNLASLIGRNALKPSRAYNQNELEELANELDESFNHENPSLSEQNNQARLDAFNNFCEKLMHSPSISLKKKNAIKTLLSLRIAA